MMNDNKESLRRLLYQMVGNALDAETRAVTLRLAIERQKAIDALVDENKSVIRHIVEDNKRTIRANAQEISEYYTVPPDDSEKLFEPTYKMTEPAEGGTTLELPTPDVSTNHSQSLSWTELGTLPPPRPGQNTSN